MDQTIRVSGEKESIIRSRLNEVEENIRKCVKNKWNIDFPLYDAYFFVVFNDRSRLGEFKTGERIILLSEDLLYLDFSILKNVFLHETAHALTYELRGVGEGHSPFFRECCYYLGVEEGFEKAKIRRAINRDEELKHKVEKLMALSSSPFENEAMIALSKARKLLLENSFQAEKDKDTEDKIYFVTLYEGGRIPFYISRLSRFVGKATGCYILKVLGGGGKNTEMKAYGSLEEVEASLYLFSSLLSSLEKEVEKLRREGHKITKDSFTEGACPEMERKLRKADSSSDNALVVVQDENKEKAKRICLKEYRFVRGHSNTHLDSNSMNLGREFGRKVDISSSMGRKELKS